jgi:predicted transglutaminase-like cysteine proteinase
VGIAAPAHASSVGWSGQNASSSGNLGPALGAPISQSTMIARAADWIDSDVPYSQSLGWSDAATGGAYRQDCSGFVSMAWALNSSLVTWTLPNVSTVIAGNIQGFTGLQPGDALDYTADHVVLFDSWIDKSAGTFYYDAEHETGVAPSRDIGNVNGSTLEGYPISDFEALRYHNAVGGGFTGGVATVMNGTNAWTAAVESDGHLHEIIQTPTDISDNILDNATFTGAVSSVMNGTQFWIAAVESDGHLHEIIQTPSDISDNILDNATFPSAVSSVMNGTQFWTTAVESDGRLHEIIQTPSTVSDDVLGNATFSTGGVSAAMNGINLWTMAVESDSHLHEIIQTPTDISDNILDNATFRQS